MFFLFCSALCGLATFKIKRHGLSGPWPWAAMALFAAVLLAGQVQPLARPDRLIGFATLTSTLIIGDWWRDTGHMRLLSAFLSAAVIGNAVWVGGRPFAIDNPNIVAGWILLLPLGWWSMASLVATQSMGAVAGAFIGLLLQHLSKLRWVAVGGAMLLMVVVMRPGLTFNRWPMWREGLAFFAARPLFGWGPGSYWVSLTGGEMSAVVGTRTGYGHAHNAAITIAAETGLAGLVPLVFVVWGLGKVVAGSNHPERWMLAAYAVQQIVDDTWLYPPTALLLGLALVRIGGEVNG